ncbi:MAG: hypothetical protein IPG75_15660 [Gemmatimonadetes bacterium]|nr:hypothetical protein [Gemmatimonadota bacterium]
MGVFLAWWQLRLSQRQATTDFEDSLAEQYRNIVHELPVGALLGEDIGETEYKAALDDFLPLHRPEQHPGLPARNAQDLGQHMDYLGGGH